MPAKRSACGAKRFVTGANAANPSSNRSVFSAELNDTTDCAGANWLRHFVIHLPKFRLLLTQEKGEI
jgi:hypothetical protein